MTNRYWAKHKHGKKANCHCPPFNREKMLNNKEEGWLEGWRQMPETRMGSQTTLHRLTADVKHRSEGDDELELLTAESSPSWEYVQQRREFWPRDEQERRTEGVEPGCLDVCVHVCVCTAPLCVHLPIQLSLFIHSLEFCMLGTGLGAGATKMKDGHPCPPEGHGVVKGGKRYTNTAPMWAVRQLRVGCCGYSDRGPPHQLWVRAGRGREGCSRERLPGGPECTLVTHS